MAVLLLLPYLLLGLLGTGTAGASASTREKTTAPLRRYDAQLSFRLLRFTAVAVFQRSLECTFHNGTALSATTRVRQKAQISVHKPKHIGVFFF